MEKDCLHLFSRVVVSGDRVEVYNYSTPIRSGYERDFEIVRKPIEDRESAKRLDNILRARQTARRVIWSNMTPKTKFVTLTYAKTELDFDKVKNDIKYFVKVLRRANYDCPYFYVLEHQQARGEKEGNKGSLHVHMLIFNDEKLPLELLNKAWKHGIADITMVRGKKDPLNGTVRDVGAYVCKYITEQGSAEFGDHFYGCSRGLKRPTVERFYTEGLSDTTFLHPSDILSALNVLYHQTVVHDFSTTEHYEKDYHNMTVDYYQGTWKEGNIIEQNADV